jgi:glycosyltransferase involved in cell wall biosynthesis
MKIAISNTIFFIQKFGGISRYFINLSNEFDKSKLEYKIIAPISKNILLKKKHNNKISLHFSRFPNTAALVNLNNFLFNRYIQIFNPDILHETYYSNNVRNFKKIKILTIYDTIHEKYSENYSKEQIDRKKKVLNYVDHFICISKYTQECFVELYNIPINKTSVIYLSGEHIKKKLNYNHLIFEKYNLKKNSFFLFVGSRDKYKNFQLLKECLILSNKFRDFKIVCFGGGNFSHYEFNNLNDSFINIQGDDGELKYLYENAFALIAPSIEEGFGITILEAMELGCPVLCSDIKVFREVGGLAPMYFSPSSEDELIDRMEKLILDKSRRDLMIKEGLNRCKSYSWKFCANQTEKIYKSLL